MNNNKNKGINSSKTLIIIGGGAAGFFCAINAAKQNKNLCIIIIEKNNKVLSKVKVSGGGRCNVTHNCLDIAELSKNYPRGENFLKKAFHWFNVKNTIDWFKEHNVELKTEDDGRMFPTSNSSDTIIDCFLSQINKFNIKLLLQTDIKKIVKEGSKFIFEANGKEILKADFVCITAGGYSKIEQFDWFKVFNHIIIHPNPSLFTFNIPNNNIKELMGISVTKAKVKIINSKFQTEGPLLITHWGLSGPAILKLSSIAARELASLNYTFRIQINWNADWNEVKVRNEIDSIKTIHPKQKIINGNFLNFSNRLWLYFLQQSLINDDLRWVDLTSKQINLLVKTITNQEFEVKGKTTFKEEFVTCGGISLLEIDVNTMQSKKVKNLFFAGEILDIDGITGGFNFQAAWTTAWLAAKTIATKSLD